MRFVLVAGAAGAGWFAGRLEAQHLPALPEHEAALQKAAAAAQVDPDLLRALVFHESGGDARARSKAGARGLTQLMPATAREAAERLHLAPPDDAALEDPALNLRLGAAYLASMLRQFDGQEWFALAAYNAGATPVRRWRARAADTDARGVILREGYDATRAYVAKVMRLRNRYRAER